jgi:hypothetical protein
MSKHSDRHKKQYMIRAAANATHPILCEVESVEWIKAAEGETPAADAPKRFKMRAYTGGPMSVGMYGAPVAIDLGGLTAKAPVPILMNHDPDRIVGHADEVSIGASTLDLAGLVSGSTPESDQVTASAKLGFPWKASVGARPDKMEFVGEGATTKVNGKTFTGPLYVARKSTLGEVSFVAMAADSKTTAKVAARAAHSSERNVEMEKFHEWLQAKGFDPAALSATQSTFLRAMYDEEEAPVTPPEPPPAPAPAPPTPAAELRASAAAETTRIAAIAKLCRNEFPEIQAQAISEGWDAIRCELAVVRAERPIPLPIHGSSRDAQPAVIEAALCMAGGLREVEKAFKPEVLEAAHAYQRREGSSLQGLILATARDNGYSGAHRIHRGNYDEVMKAALIQASAPSTHTLTTLLSTVGNKFLLEGFLNVEQIWREISASRPVNDFKQITSYRMLDDMVFEELGPAGEIKHGTASQESYTNQAKTYAKMLGLTRTDIINDDLGAFDTIRERLGAGSGRKLNSVFWAAFLDDATFFATGAASHANLLTAVLGETGIAAANVLLKAQTAADGHPLGVGLQHLLLTGATLNPTARKWYVSQELRDTTASTKTLNSNIYFNTYRPVESAYITSTTSWYLLPIGGGSMAPMEVCFLDNVQSPTIESAEADFNTLGIQFRGYFDFGVAKKEWRASVKSTGAG